MKLTLRDLAGMLEFGGYLSPDDVDDDRQMAKVGYLCDLINSHIECPDVVDPVSNLMPSDLTQTHLHGNWRARRE